MKKNIYLSGFMGTGKTTAGRIAARSLGVPFLDTDSAIEKKMGLTIAQIFSRKGETAFRKAEREALLSTLHSPPSLVAVGGGAVLSETNRNVLRTGIWINLNADPAVIFKRIGDKKSRPLIRKKAARETVEALIKTRLPFYRLAPYQVEASFLSPDAVVDRILRVARTP